MSEITRIVAKITSLRPWKFPRPFSFLPNTKWLWKFPMPFFLPNTKQPWKFPRLFFLSSKLKMAMEISKAIFCKHKMAMEISKAIFFYKHKMAMGISRHYPYFSSQTNGKMETQLDHFKRYFTAIKLLWKFSVFFLIKARNKQTLLIIRISSMLFKRHMLITKTLT